MSSSALSWWTLKMGYFCELRPSVFSYSSRMPLSLSGEWCGVKEAQDAWWGIHINRNYSMVSGCGALSSFPSVLKRMQQVVAAGGSPPIGTLLSRTGLLKWHCPFNILVFLSGCREMHLRCHVAGF